MACDQLFILAFATLLLVPAICDVTTPHVCKDDGKCFTVIPDQQLTWEQAEEYCENNLPNGRLASIHNAFDNSIIAGWLPFLSTNPWIGAFRIGSLPFLWTDGTEFSNQYTNWASDQPTGHCAQVCRSTTSAGNSCQQGKWTTADCSNQAQIICEYGNLTESTTTPPQVPVCPDQWTMFSVTQSCYRCHALRNTLRQFQTFFNPVSWMDAEATCRNNGGALTSIHSLEENNFIGDFASEHVDDEDYHHQTFIGLQDLKHNRQWSWSDGTTVNFLNWAPGEPDPPDNTVEFCVELYSSRGASDPNTKYHWNDVQCEESQRAFVCKRAPVLN